MGLIDKAKPFVRVGWKVVGLCEAGQAWIGLKKIGCRAPGEAVFEELTPPYLLSTKVVWKKGMNYRSVPSGWNAFFICELERQIGGFG